VQSSVPPSLRRDTRWRSCLRHCTTSRKLAGSFPNGVIWIFLWYNLSARRAMALGSNRLLTEMSTRSISWGLRWPVRRADNLTTFMCKLSWNLGASTSWNPQGLSTPVMAPICLLASGKLQCSSLLPPTLFKIVKRTSQIWHLRTSPRRLFVDELLNKSY
jgi:hypothetical protein